MTKVEMTNRMAEIRTNIEGLVKSYNDAVQEAKFSDMARLDAEITAAINEYTSLSRTICFDECAASDDPMLEAIKRLSYLTIGVKDGKAEETEIPVREVIEREKQIDLLKLHKYIEGGIGIDHNWPYMVERFNMALTAQKALDLGIDPREISDSYAMSEIARGIDLGKTPTSKTNILKTMRGIIAAMIGEEFANAATSHDVNFLLSVYSRKNRKALTVSCANHKYLRGYVMEICHRVVTDGTYAVEYKRVKGK